MGSFVQASTTNKDGADGIDEVVHGVDVGGEIGPLGRVFKIIFLCETVFYAVLRVLIRFATRFSMRFSYRQRLMSIIFVLHKRSLTL